MSKKNGKRYEGKFKAKVVIESLKNEKTLLQIASENKIMPKNIINWKKIFLEKSAAIFETEKSIRDYERKLSERDSSIEELYKQIGKLAAQLEWLKKKCRENGFGIETPLY